MIYETPQNPHTGGMKGGDPHTLRAKSYQIVYTIPHLSGCLIGKGNCHDIPWIHALFLNQICNAVRQHPGLSGSCSRQN